MSGYWSGGFCPKGAHCPFRANQTNSTAFAAFHFGLDGMSVQWVDSSGGVLWTSPALPRRRKSEVTRTKSDDAAAVRVDRSDVFLPGDGFLSPMGEPLPTPRWRMAVWPLSAADY